MNVSEKRVKTNDLTNELIHLEADVMNVTTSLRKEPQPQSLM